MDFGGGRKLVLPATSKERPGSRPVPVSWRSAPLDMQAVGFKGMLSIHLPVKREWTESQRRLVEQVVVDSALHALHGMESDGVKT
jgi:hypothetical protein